MMLIPEDDKRSEAQAEASSQPFPSDGPPPYAPLWAGLSMRTPFRPRPLDIPATNYVMIKRQNSAVRGTFVIDPALPVPHELLVHHSHEGDFTGESGQHVVEQKNLELESKNASVSADVWLVDDTELSRGESPAEMKRAELEFRSNNAAVYVTLDATTTRPFSLVAHSKNAAVRVAIPSDFVGPVTMTSVNGGVSLPGTIKSRLVAFSEENGTRHCFIGNYKNAEYTGKNNWKGSMVDIGSHNGRVTLAFIDEEDQNRGFWSKLFGM